MTTNKVCLTCNITFSVKPSKMDKRLFCSRECYVKYNVGEKCPSFKNAKKIGVCETCKKEFIFFPSVRKTAKFCSKACHWEYKKTLTGEKSNNWQGGAKDYYGANWVYSRQKTRKRDNYTCQMCGIPESENGRDLDVHHKKPFDLCGNYEEANQLDNLISLCKSCHKIAEKESTRIYGKPKRDAKKTDMSFVTPTEAAEQIGVSVWMIYKHIYKKRIKTINLSEGFNLVRPRIMIERVELERFIKSQSI